MAALKDSVYAMGVNTNDYNVDTVEVTVTDAPVALTVTNTPSVTTVYPGHSFTYTVTIKNNQPSGGITATSVDFADYLSKIKANIGYISHTITGSTGTLTIDGNGDLVGNLGDIAADTTVTIVITVKALAA